MNATARVEQPRNAATVLLVEDDKSTRDHYGEWLEAAGYIVSQCPGPTGSAPSCLGVRGLSCALGHGADIVLLDSRRLPGADRAGKPGWQLLRYYVKGGKPIVLIADRYRVDRGFRPEQLAVLHSSPGRESVLLAVRRMLQQSRRW